VFKLSRKFKVVHPFHPLRGKEFEAICFRRSWGSEYVEFRMNNGDGGVIPLEWTDAMGVDPFCEMSRGRSFFRVRELLDLVEMLKGL
jgi:hypothetical protein